MGKEECKDTSRISILLTYMTIILAISQIFDIVYEITSKLYTSVDQLVRKFIMYVLLELPLALISIYLTAVSICCIIKIMYLKFDYMREEIIEESRGKTTKKQRKKKIKEYQIITKKKEEFIKYKKEIIKRWRLAIKINITEILTISLLPITSYMTMAAVVFQFNFKELQYSLYLIIFALYFIFSIMVLFCIANSKGDEKIFSNENFFIKAVNYIHKLVTHEDIIAFKIAYIVPVLLNIILVFGINIIDNFFINLEDKIVIEKEIEDNKKIKYEIIIDRLLDKVGINIADEDIEQYKKDLKEKYKMEE